MATHPSILDTTIIDLLEADPRPSFIVALVPEPPTVVYTNPAFAAYPARLDLITARDDDAGEMLWKWITDGSTSSGLEAPAKGAAFPYSDAYWTRSVVHEQMVVVGANEQIPSSERPPRTRQDSSVSPPGRDSSLPSPGIDRRAKPTPTILPLNTKETSSRPELVQSLGRSASDPGWILPDTTPGKLAHPSRDLAST